MGRRTPYGMLRYISLVAQDVQNSIYTYGDIDHSIYDVYQMREACDELLSILEKNKSRSGQRVSFLDEETKD